MAERTAALLYVVVNCCLPFDPFPVLRNVSGVEQLAGGRVLAEFLLADGATIHERLCDDRQTRVDGARLADVEDKVRVLDDADPEPQRQTATHVEDSTAAG
jgi:hypothetical protein